MLAVSVVGGWESVVADDLEASLEISLGRLPVGGIE